MGMTDQIIDRQEEQIRRIEALKKGNKDPSEVLADLVLKGINVPVPTSIKKNAPNPDGNKTMGIVIGESLRVRLTAQREKLGLPSYRAVIFAAINIGLRAMEESECREETNTK